MEFFVKPTVSGVNSLIVAIQYDYNSTINMLKKSFNIEKVSQLVKSNLWVALHTKEASKKNYSLYVHKFTGCNIKVYSKKDNPDLEKMRRKLLDHINRYKQLQVERLTNSSVKFLNKKGKNSTTNLEDLYKRVCDAYHNAIEIIKFLQSIHYKHGGEGSQSNAANKRGFKPEKLKSLLPEEAWKADDPASGHYCQKNTILPSVTMGGSNHKSDVTEGELIDFAKKIQEYVNRLSIDFFKLPFGFLNKVVMIEKKINENGSDPSILEWYKQLPTFAITQYLASNVSD